MLRKQFCLFWFLLIITCQGIASSKTEAIGVAKDVYSIHPYTFFCEKPIENDGTVFVRSCDLCPPIPTKVEWMDIVPNKRLAKDRVCYSHPVCLDKKGHAFKGIRCCRQMDKNFAEMESDLYNIAPEEPMLNRFNKTNQVAQVEPIKGQFVCDFRYDYHAKKIEPPTQSKGMVARTYLYYQSQYGLSLTPEEKELFLEWHHAYPPTPWERERSTQIYALTGKLNAWVH